MSLAPNRVSSDLGKLDVRRHLISGADCAMAGAATAAQAASPTPAVFKNSRRFMALPLVLDPARIGVRPSEPAPTCFRSYAVRRGKNKAPELCSGASNLS